MALKNQPPSNKSRRGFLKKGVSGFVFVTNPLVFFTKGASAAIPLSSLQGEQLALVSRTGFPAAIFAGVASGILSELLKDTLKLLKLWPGVEADRSGNEPIPQHQEQSTQLSGEGYDVTEIYDGAWAPTLSEASREEDGDAMSDESVNQDDNDTETETDSDAIDNEQADRTVELHFGSRFELSEAVLDERFRAFATSIRAGQTGSVHLERGDVIAQYLLAEAITRSETVSDITDWMLPIDTIIAPTHDRRYKLNHQNTPQFVTPAGSVSWRNTGFSTSSPRIWANSRDEAGNVRAEFEFRTSGRPDRWTYRKLA